MNSLHPFPARMAPAIVYDFLPEAKPGQRVLDPMAGSGTTVTIARAKGYVAVGSDTDPLALIIARANSGNMDAPRLQAAAAEAMQSAVRRVTRLLPINAYPDEADEETRAFIDFWFDARARVELVALKRAIEHCDPSVEAFLLCAFSRMIITKKNGVSLAEDVPHSRPHRTRKHPPIYPLEAFMPAVKSVVRAQNFSEGAALPEATVVRADCRQLPFSDELFEHIITSPPYLNAIDYMRGHKMSLVWFGHKIATLRDLRASNVGTELGSSSSAADAVVDRMASWKVEKSLPLQRRLRRYVQDLNEGVSEMRRVIRRGGQLLMVVGDCTVEGCDVKNSVAVDILARRAGFELVGRSVRQLEPRHRYLPPPRQGRGGSSPLQKRMWNETILRYKAV